MKSQKGKGSVGSKLRNYINKNGDSLSNINEKNVNSPTKLINSNIKKSFKDTPINFIYVTNRAQDLRIIDENNPFYLRG